jgi:tetratricopeptide (TPR) repeat protein
MDEVLDTVQHLKDSAKTNRDFGDFYEALDDLEEAIEILKQELAAVEQFGPPKEETQVLLRQKLGSELADCHGMAGGVYRRLGDFARSSAMYEAGRGYEQDPAYGLVDSYNLTNSIVVQILADGRNLFTLHQEILNAAETVDRQVEEKRREQWWAWCDVGVLALLNRNSERAREAYRRFKEKGALAKHFDSTIEVLEGLRDALKPVEPSISSSISDAVDFLRCERPLR